MKMKTTARVTLTKMQIYLASASSADFTFFKNFWALKVTSIADLEAVVKYEVKIMQL